MRSIGRLFPRVIAPVSTVLLSSLIASGAHAADHQEAPGTMAQLAADIGDYYIWHADDKLNMVLTFGTFSSPELPATFDRDVIYGFHFDTTAPADGESDIDIYARFSQSVAGEWGVQISGLGDSPLEGAVETVLSSSDLSAWAGLSDDPFFFDQTGFNTTLSTGTLSFDPNRDDVAGLNVTAIAIQLPISSIISNSGNFQSWVTTSSL
jgi:hypothetical protein